MLDTTTKGKQNPSVKIKGSAPKTSFNLTSDVELDGDGGGV
jgi:hypothetical protein